MLCHPQKAWVQCLVPLLQMSANYLDTCPTIHNIPDALGQSLGRWHPNKRPELHAATYV